MLLNIKRGNIDTIFLMRYTMLLDNMLSLEMTLIGYVIVRIIWKIISQSYTHRFNLKATKLNSLVGYI